MKSRLARKAAGLLFVLAATTFMALAQTETPVSSDYAILIVGDENDIAIHQREKDLILEMKKVLLHDKNKKRLPLYSYHFNQEKERKYCETKLGVIREDLLFVGIVSLNKDRVPRRVMYRLDRILTPSRAAADILTRADELTPTETPSPSVSPEVTPSTSPSTSPSPGTTTGGRFRVQLGVFTQQKFAQDLVDQLKAKGYDARFEKIAGDGGKDTFKVWVGTFQTKEDAQQASGELQTDGFEKGFVVEGH